jgi:Flp pilus assembly protein CpaB
MRTIGLPELLVIMSAVTLIAVLIGVVIWAIVHKKRV